MLSEFTNMDDEYDDIGNLVNMTLNQEYPGLVPLLMDELCRRAGCTWRNSHVAYGYDILSKNQKSFNDLADWSTSIFDVNLDWWMRSTNRLRQGITFTEKWYDGSIILVAKKPEETTTPFDPLSWLLPFDNNVWFMTIATIFFSAAVYWFLEVLNPKSDGEESRLSTMETIWMFATAFTGQFEFDPQTHPARLFTFSIAFWALLMSAAYTANLASFLVVATTPDNPIETVGQAVRAAIPMCIWKSSQTDTRISAAFPAYSGSGLLKRLDTQQALFEGVQSGLCEIAITEVSSWEAFQYNNDVNSECNLQLIGRAFEFIPASFVMKNDAGDLCTSLIKAVFDLHLHHMEREGVIQDLWEGHIEQTATVFCTDDQEANPERRERFLKSNDSTFRRLKAANNAAAEAGGNDSAGFDDTTKLSLANMGGVFLLHAILSLLSIICAAIAWYRGKSKKVVETENDNSKDTAPTKNFCSSRAESVSSDAFYDAIEGKSAVEGLRIDMDAKLRAIYTKLDQLMSLEKCNSQDTIDA